MNDFSLGITIGTVVGICGVLILLLLQGEISLQTFTTTIVVLNLSYVGLTLSVNGLMNLRKGN